MPAFPIAQVANPHLANDVVLGLIGVGGFSVAVGLFLIRQAWGNLQDGRVPLVGSIQLTGALGRLGALVLLVAGMAAMVSGVGLVAFILWRLVASLAAA
jgi:hypothetical protein